MKLMGYKLSLFVFAAGAAVFGCCAPVSAEAASSGRYAATIGDMGTLLTLDRAGGSHLEFWYVSPTDPRVHHFMFSLLQQRNERYLIMRDGRTCGYATIKNLPNGWVFLGYEEESLKLAPQNSDGVKALLSFEESEADGYRALHLKRGPSDMDRSARAAIPHCSSAT